MENKSFDIILDIEKDLYNATNMLFDISQNDLNDVQLNFFIQANGADYDLTGTTVELAVKKPSGLTTYTTAAITDAAAGRATIMLGVQSYSEYGIYRAEVNIRTADTMAVTSAFWYSVREAIMNTTDFETINDWSALQQALFAYDQKPMLVDGVPTAVPAYIGQTAFDTTGQRAFISFGLDAADWMQLGASATGGTSVSWADILGKPATFAPAAHTHTIADVTDLQAALDSKADDTDLAAYLTEAEGDTRYQPAGTAPDLTGYLTEAEGDSRYQPIGTEPDLTGYLTETDAAATYQPIGDYLTTAEGDTRYQAAGTAPDMTGYLTETDAAATYLPLTTDLFTQTEADARYLPQTTDLFTQTEADARYQQLGTDTPDDWTEITNKPATFPPSAHQHTSADITDFAAAVAADIPAEYLTQTEGDGRYSLKGTTGTASSVDWGNITGDITTQTDLQNALAAKADDSDLTGLLSQTAADARYQQLGTDVPDDWVDITNKPATFPPSAHQHTSADITDFAAAVAADIPAEYLTQTEGDGRYLASTTDLFTQAEADALYLTPAEGDARYQAAGTEPDLTGYAPLASPAFTGAPTAPTPAAGDNSTAIATTAFVSESIPDTSGMLTQTDADARYQQLGTDTPDDWVDITNKPATFPPSAHTHAVADVTGLQGDLDAKAPLASPTFTGTPAAPTPAAGTNTTQLATTAFVQAALPNTTGLAPLASPAFTGTPTAPTPAAADNTTKIATTAFVNGAGFLKTIPLASGTAVGGVQVGNGLGMSGNYLYTKTGAGLGIDANSMLQVQTTNTTPAPVKFWIGIQTDYDAITIKDANTLYFITG